MELFRYIYSLLSLWTFCCIILRDASAYRNMFRQVASSRTLSSHGWLRLPISSLYCSENSNSVGAKVTPTDKTLPGLISEAENYEREALEQLANAADSKEIEALRVLYLGKNGKITSMMKEMKVLAPADKPKLGEIVNRAKSRIEEVIESSKVEMKDKEILNRIQLESLGNTFQPSSIPGFYRGPGKRHPIPLVLDLTTEIFEEIGYEVITGPENSPEIENDFYNFEALGMPPSVSSA